MDTFYAATKAIESSLNFIELDVCFFTWEIVSHQYSEATTGSAL